MPGEKNEGETKNRILFRDRDRRDGTQERVLCLRWGVAGVYEWKEKFSAGDDSVRQIGHESTGLEPPVLIK